MPQTPAERSSAAKKANQTRKRRLAAKKAAETRKRMAMSKNDTRLGEAERVAEEQMRSPVAGASAQANDQQIARRGADRMQGLTDPLSLSASARARTTAQWATKMTLDAIAHATSGQGAGTKVHKKWQCIHFPGPNGGESRGIVDLLTIRRDHHTETEHLSRGDLFEMLLVQVKGGGAPLPPADDRRRLRAVQNYYRAKDVVLSSCLKGATEPTFYVLKPLLSDQEHLLPWRQAPAAEIFGRSRPPAAGDG